MFSAMYLNAVLIIVAIIVIAGLLVAMDYLTSSSFYVRDKQEILKETAGTKMLLIGFNYTNYSTPDKVELYLRDTGNTIMETDCIDLAIDGLWIERENLTISLLDTSYDPDLWNPDEIIKVETLTDLDVGEHEARLIACNGGYNEGLFNASRCGDNTCTGGEYCGLDNSSCPDNVCQDPVCSNGCTQAAITDDIDAGECDSSNAAGNCLSTPCQCGPTSNCCGLNLADCTGDQNCCPGYACGPGNKCRVP